MDSKLDCCYEPFSPTPKLSLHSFPSKINESPWMATPPIHTLASVPFQWEEAPGKPRPCTTQSCDEPKSVRCLELPPRLLVEARIVNIQSTVLEGPYMTRSSSLGKGFADGLEIGRRVSKDKSVFASGRWGSFRKHNTEVPEGTVADNYRYSPDGVGGPKAKITRLRRRSSFTSFSNKRSHLWTNICDNIKQVVRRRLRLDKSA